MPGSSCGGSTPQLNSGRPLEQARRGDLQALPRLRAILDRSPEIWRRYGDLAAHAEAAWRELIGGPDLALKESTARAAEALRAELSGPSPTPLERLLAGRVVACWLQVHHADAALADAQRESVRQAEFALKRLDRAQRRYLQAIGARATLRRLLPGVAEPAAPSRDVLPAPGPGPALAVGGDGLAPKVAEPLTVYPAARPVPAPGGRRGAVVVVPRRSRGGGSGRMVMRIGTGRDREGANTGIVPSPDLPTGAAREL